MVPFGDCPTPRPAVDYQDWGGGGELGAANVDVQPVPQTLRSGCWPPSKPEDELLFMATTTPMA